MDILRSAGGALRVLAKKSVLADGRFTHRRVPGTTMTIYETTYRRGDASSEQDCDYYIYLHGGAFTMCDSGDLLIARGLLPLLNREECSVFGLLYPLSAKEGGEGHFALVARELVAAYDFIRSVNPRGACLGIVGDSAGGNAALSLAQQLVARGEETVCPKLCLISPWLDVFKDTSAQAAHGDYEDMLVYSWLKASRERYFGAGVSSLADVGLLHDAQGQSAEPEVLASKFASLAATVLGFQVVAFDMDQCMVASHSWGSLQRSQLDGFTSKITADFVLLAQACAAAGIKLAVATHSDAAEYSALRPKERHRIGEELARKCISAAGLRQEDFFVFSYNPAARGMQQDATLSFKKLHMRSIAAHYGVAEDACLLLDDDEGNVNNTGGKFSAIKVDPRLGLRTGPALASLARLAEQRVRTPLPPQIDCPAAKGLASPHCMSNDTLAGLPAILIIAGEKELLFDEIAYFAARMASLEERRARADVYLVGRGDIHAYPLHNIHPIRLVMRAAGANWLFNLLYPSRAEQYQATGSDSPQAYEALVAMARFLVS